VQRGSGKLILQDIRFEKREAGTVLRSGKVELLLGTVRLHGNSLLVLSVRLLLSHFLVTLDVDGSGGGGFYEISSVLACDAVSVG